MIVGLDFFLINQTKYYFLLLKILTLIQLETIVRLPSIGN